MIAAGLDSIDRLPLLERHRGGAPDLLLTWNQLVAPPARLDIVLHLHGYAQAGADIDILRDKMPISGLDFKDPDPPDRIGRLSPTLGLLPRGNHFGGRSGHGFDFPALGEPGAVETLLAQSLERFADVTGCPVPAIGRRILTAHSGGGAALAAVGTAFQPDEIHVFDALYAPSPWLAEWVVQRQNEPDSALRVFYVAGTGTEPASLALDQTLDRQNLTNDPRRFRVEPVTIPHGRIARYFGWHLLRDAAAQFSP